MQHLDDLCDCALKIQHEAVEALTAKLNHLHMLLDLRKNLDNISSLIRQDKPLPVRRITYNLKILPKTRTSRWSKLLELDFRSLVFCMLSFQGLGLLPDTRFTALVDNVSRYLQVQTLSSDWIVRDQLRGFLAKVPKQDSTKGFLAGYHKTELEYHVAQPTQSDNRIASADEGSADERTALDRITAEELPQELASDRSGTSTTTKRPRLSQDARPQTDKAEPAPKQARISPGESLETDRYFSFTFVKHERLHNLPDSFLLAIRESQSWKVETNEGLAGTNCISLLMPKTNSEDAVFQITVGYNSAWKIFCSLGLGDWDFS